MSDNQNHIKRLTPELILKYQKGELSHAQMHEVEKLLLESEFESEAMEGFETLDAIELEKDLNSLNQRLEDRIKKSKPNRWGFYLKIAASVTILAVSIWLIIDFTSPAVELSPISQTNEEQTDQENAKAQKSVEENVSENEEDELAEVEKPDLDTQEKLPSPVMGTEPLEEEPTEALAATEAKEDEGFISETKPVAKQQAMELPTDTIDVSLDMSIADLAAAEEEKKEVNVSEQLTGKVAGVQAEREEPAMVRAPARSRAKKSAAAEAVSADDVQPVRKISGKVTSDEDGEPLPGVNVILKGSTIGTVTDIEGNYQLEVPADQANTLIFSFIGLNTFEVATNNSETLDVELSPDVQALSEVVVTGYGVSTEEAPETYKSAQPVNGRSEFKTYVEENLRYPANQTEEGRVVIKFTVRADGSLDNFEVTRSMGVPFDEEALRLVIEGPKWLPAERNGTAVESQAKVRIRFKRE